MKFQKTIPLLLGLLLNQAQLVHAGSDSHGQTGVFCTDRETITLDYYQATLPQGNGAGPTLLDFSTISSSDLKQKIEERIALFPTLFKEYNEAKAILKSSDLWKVASLSGAADDTGAPYTLPPGCVDHRVAAQAGTQAFRDITYFKTLNPYQVVLTETHEYLYYVAIKNKWDFSIPVRDVILEVLKVDLDLVSFIAATTNLMKLLPKEARAIKFDTSVGNSPNALITEWSVSENNAHCTLTNGFGATSPVSAWFNESPLPGQHIEPTVTTSEKMVLKLGEASKGTYVAMFIADCWGDRVIPSITTSGSNVRIIKTELYKDSEWPRAGFNFYTRYFRVEFEIK